MWLWPDTLLHLIPGYLIYQILGTSRHELSHAVAYLFSGYGITRICVLPSQRDGQFYWGYVESMPKMGAKMNIHIMLAPYYTDLICIGMWFLTYIYAPRPWVPNDARLSINLWICATVLLLLSPITDMLYNLTKWVRGKGGDFAEAAAYAKLH